MDEPVAEREYLKIRLLNGGNPEVEGVHTTDHQKAIIRAKDSQLQPSIASMLWLVMLLNNEWAKGE